MDRIEHSSRHRFADIADRFEQIADGSNQIIRYKVKIDGSEQRSDVR